MRSAVEEPTQEGTDTFVFTDPVVRVAFDDYLHTLTHPSTADERETKRAALAALDDATRTEQLAYAFEQTELMQRWVVLFVMSKVPSEASLAFAQQFFAATVWDEYDAYMSEVSPTGKSGDLDQGMKLVIRALHLVMNCVDAEVAEAEELILELATTYELADVRRAAIREIETRGSSALRSELAAVVDPEDEPWLNPPPFPEDYTIEFDSEDSAFEDPETVPE